MELPIPQINFDDFNKFVSSCGFFLIIIAVLSLCIDVEIFAFSCCLTIGLFVIGAAAMAFGLINWYKRQDKLDEKLDLEIKIIKKELSSATDIEKDKNLKEIINESSENFSQPSNKNIAKIQEYQNNVYKLLDKLSKFNNPKYKVLIEQKISGKHIYDAIFMANTRNINDKVIEIKYIQSFASSNHIDPILFRLTGMLAEYKKEISKSANAVLLLLCDEVTVSSIKMRQKIIKRALGIPELKGLQVEIIDTSQIESFDPDILCV